ncbi:MAG: FAD-binding oxidoreductase [Chloroflexi bacterium]|nr:FAD-binding oxidoreductase [Chloroflexota bacterium]
MDTALIAAFAELTGPGGIVAGEAAARYAVDGLYPAMAVSPAAAEQAAAVLALANREGLAVIPWGGGSGMALGNLPRRYDLALSLTQLDALVRYVPADLTLTVQAGMPLARLNETLAAHGQHLPFDPPGAGRATVGGIVARNATGPRRMAYGAPRDLLIGCQAALPDGTLARAGGNVVKNVAGYDLNRLYTGSLGTLAILLETTFKVLPLPAELATVAVGLRSLDDAITLGRAVCEAPVGPLALEALDLMAVQRIAALLSRALPDTGAQLTAGLPVSILRDSGPQAALWAAVRDLGREPEGGAVLAIQAAVLPSLTAEAAALLAGALPHTPPMLRAHVGGGIVEGFWDTSGDPAETAAALGELARLVGARQGNLAITNAPPELKALIDIWGQPSAAFPLMQRVKAQFDPHGTLNPGRFVGRL